MVSSSQATTASADASDDDANLKRETIEHTRDKKTIQHDKHSKLEATVKWMHEGQLHEQPGLLFDLQYHASYNTAFFKLRASVAIKAFSMPEQVSLFLLIAPEAIQTLSLSSDHARELGPNTVCLRFGLKTDEAPAPALVVPKDMDLLNVTWNNKQSSELWDSLRSLARAKNFDVLCRLPRRVMSEARLQSLCEALSSHQIVSTPGYADTGGLYGGTGGKEVQTEVKGKDHASEESPPAYQDLEPGPPMPPILQEKTSNKRRRGNSDTDSQRTLREPKDGLEGTVAWLVTELKKHEAREASLVTELKEVNAKVAMLVSEQEQHRAKCTMLENDLDDRVGGVEARLDELNEELESTIDCRIDEALDQKSASIREELVDYVDETLPNRIQGALEEATFSARF